MPISLFAATVPAYLQILGAVSGLLDKAEHHCGEHGIEPEELIQARLAEDMRPFSYQVKAMAMHSAGAIEGFRKGLFTPDTGPFPESFDALRQVIQEAQDFLLGISPEDLDWNEDHCVRFEVRDVVMEFAARDFLFSFSQPNFYFHATTAYDILRMKGVAIGKRDFLLGMRVKA
jgi:hypothetical protein